MAAALFYYGGSDVKPRTERPLTETLSTAKGEHHCWKLPDATQACLNTGTTVRIIYTRRSRNVEVETGEAEFTVGHENRPFQVLSNGLLTLDVGTRFDIYRRRDGTTALTVIQGSVKTKPATDEPARQRFVLAEPEPGWDSALEIHRLQQLVFDESSGTLHEPSLLSEQQLSRLLAWERGVVVLTGMRLSEVLEELPRYQSVEQFNVPDKELRQLTLDGESDLSDLHGFLSELTQNYGIRTTLARGSDGQTVVTLSRPRSAHKQSR